MLLKYNKYLNAEILTESFVKPDPPNVKAVYNTQSYYDNFTKLNSTAKNEITKIINTERGKYDKVANAAKVEYDKIANAAKAEMDKIIDAATIKYNKEVTEEMVNRLKKDLLHRQICIIDEKGSQKILDVNDVILGEKGTISFPVLVENNDTKYRYCWENEGKSKIFFVDKFLEYFEEHYLNQFIVYKGKPMKGGNQKKYIKQVTEIGIYNGETQDYIAVEADDKSQQLLIHTEPIKIMDSRLKTLDPYGEENWED